MKYPNSTCSIPFFTQVPDPPPTFFSTLTPSSHRCRFRNVQNGLEVEVDGEVLSTVPVDLLFFAPVDWYKRSSKRFTRILILDRNYQLG